MSVKTTSDFLSPRKVVRVSVSNNFNCTEKEFKQLDTFAKKYPHYYFFVNCNINTPRLRALNDHTYKAVITFNPNIKFGPKSFEVLKGIAREKIGFVRVKYIPNSPEILEAIWVLSDTYPVVITAQRWNSEDSMRRHRVNKEHYVWSNSRYRLTKSALTEITHLSDESTREIYICDRKGLGCQGCGLCSELTLGRKVELTSLNMSSSGICKFNCPDCYAKTMQNMLRRFGYREIIFDKITANKKQKGDLAHIQENLKHAELSRV